MSPRPAIALLALVLATLTPALLAADEAPIVNEVAQLYASDGVLFDIESEIHDSLAIDGDTMVMGVPQHQHDGSDDFPAGAAYVFERDQAGAWIEAVELLGAAYGDDFGDSVAISTGPISLAPT